MVTLSELVKDVEIEWVVWALSGMALVWLSLWLHRGRPRLALRTIARDERGASYTLSAVLVLPLYTFLVCVIVQTTLILVVKLGTINAAYAAARSAAVFRPPVRAAAGAITSQQRDFAEQRAEREMRQAALLAMTPFASSDSEPAQVAILAIDPGAEIATVLAYRLYARDLAKDNDDYVLPRKRRYAALATDVDMVEGPEDVGGRTVPAGDVAVTVTYEMPMSIPGLGRMFGRRAPFLGARFFSRRIASTVILEEEIPQSRDRTLGIDYGYSDI